MAGNAEVGALRITLGMDAADFENGVRRVTSSMDKLSVKFGVIAGVAQEFAGQFITRIGNAFEAVATNIHNAIAEADKLGDLAKSIGINVEVLSRLQFAAALSGVEIEKFGVGISKLSKALQEIAGGAQDTPAAKAFDAIGVSVTDAVGKLLPTEEIVARLAEKFSTFSDGANKTALAINIFGKAGAGLIPFLNEGRDGIERLSAEADRLGITLDTRTAAAMGQLNDQIDTLAARTSAMWKIIAADLTPALTTLTQRWIEDAEAANGLSPVFDFIGAAVRGVVAEMIKLDSFIRLSAIGFDQLKNAFSDVATYAMGAFGGDMTEMQARYARQQAEVTIEVQRTAAALRELYKQQDSSPAAGAAAAASRDYVSPADAAAAQKPQAPGVASDEVAKRSKDALTESTKLANEAERIGNTIRKETQTITEALIAKEHELLQAWAKGAISAKTYGIAMSQAAWSAQNAHAQAASKIAGNLSGVFQQAKGFAIAQAVINTYEAFTAALKGPPGPPWSYAIAASTLAAGFAQVQNIRSTNPGSGGGSSSGGGAATAGTGGGAGSTPQVLSVQGINDSDRYSGGQMRDLANAIISYQKDGGQVLIK